MSAEQPTLSVFAHLVLYNSLEQHGAEALKACVQSLEAQDGVAIVVRDNGSTDRGLDVVQSALPGGRLVVRRNRVNLGFAAAHNQGAADFLNSDARYMLIVNPDVRLAPGAVQLMAHALERDAGAGSACPRLCRADDNLQSLEPAEIDAAGMHITPGLRHFDRGAGCPDDGRFSAACSVFGGSGACLLLKRGFVEDAQLEIDGFQADLVRVFPQLGSDAAQRAPLFDEAFFAYREDADLAWRGQLLGWRCRYVPGALGWHRRVVLPERRAALAPELNLHGVRNRFLLQFNNYTFRSCPRAFMPGVVLRNLVVIGGVLCREWRSLPALRQACILHRRARARKRALLAKAEERGTIASIGRWFHFRPYVEMGE